MTKQEAIDRLNAMEEEGDTESQHCEADDILCDFLRGIEYEDVAEAFESAVHRCGFWYA